MSASLRARWASRRRWWMWHPTRTRQEWLERKDVLTDPRPLIALPVYNVRRHGTLPVWDPSRLSEVARARLRLARLLADELVNPPVPHVPGHDLVSARSISLPVSRLASVEHAVRHAHMLPLQSPGSVTVAEGDSRSVMFAHGDTYSIVFRLDGVPSPVLVLVDELPGYAVRVDQDPEQRGRNLISAMVVGLMVNLQAAMRKAAASAKA